MISKVPLIVAVLVVAQASALGRSARDVTIVLTLLGIVSVVVAIWRTARTRTSADRAWIGSGALLHLAILLVVLWAPGVLNPWWSFSKEPPPVDPNEQVLVPYQDFLDAGQPVGDSWADAASEAIRIGDNVVVRVESAKTGHLSGMGNSTYLLVCVHLANMSRVKAIHFTGFSGENMPVLTDDGGRACTLVKQRLSRRGGGKLFFEDAPSGPLDIEINARQNPVQFVILAYEVPATLEGLRLEVPIAPLNKKGTCRFRIEKSFESLFPDRNQ